MYGLVRGAVSGIGLPCTEHYSELGMKRIPNRAPELFVYPPVLAHIQIVIETLLRQQRLVIPPFDNPPFIYHQHLVCGADRA